MNLRSILHGLSVLLSLVAIAYLARFTGLADMLETSWLDLHVRGQGIKGEIVFVAVGMIATAVGFPRQVIAFTSGYAFGFFQGTMLGLLATLLGCIVTFYYARLIGRSLIVSRYPEKIKRLDDFVKDYPFSMTLLIRLLPVGSNLVTNLAAGVSGVRALPFFSGSALGFVPQTFIFALVGSGIHVDPLLRIGVGSLLFVVSGVLGVYLYRHMRHGRQFEPALERGLNDTISNSTTSK
jgi:uncharacterized membrane protein YdjX (TVP38/TMEM64 family)